MKTPSTVRTGPVTERRWYAIGDPQTTVEKFRSILEHHGLLSGGRIKDDFGLVSIGDHFDYESDHRDAAENGMQILSFLDQHPPDQVVILAGNHDVSRVTELAHEDDMSFTRARELGEAIFEARKQKRPMAAAEARFAEEFPRIPTPGIAARDYSSFTTHQRSLIEKLLTSGRMRLACSGRIRGEPVLLTHAGVTTREVELLGVTSPDAASLARELDSALRSAVDKVRPAWARRERAALELHPLHVAGTSGSEGGGLLYHRPANPDRDGADRTWEADRSAPRRFHPRTLPRGLLQVAGHTGHRKCQKELGAWVTPAARNAPSGRVRTLQSDGVDVVYDVGEADASRGDARLYMIDGEMNHEPVTPAAYRLLELDSVDAGYEP